MNGQPVTNDLPAGNIYAMQGFNSLGMFSSAMNPFTEDGGGAPSGDPNTAAASAAGTSAGVGGHPIMWWLGMAIFIIAVMWVWKKYGGEGEAGFANILPSPYNWLSVTFQAIVGILAVKLLVNRFNVNKGLTDAINAV